MLWYLRERLTALKYIILPHASPPAFPSAEITHATCLPLNHLGLVCVCYTHSLACVARVPDDDHVTDAGGGTTFSHGYVVSVCALQLLASVAPHK